MATEITESIPTIDHKPHAAFFRQSGWLMTAAIVGGLMTLGVHFLSKRIPESEYSIFGTLLMLVACVPAMPLQMVFAQQSAQALATGRERQLAGMIRSTWLWMSILWVAAAGFILLFEGEIEKAWRLHNAMGLWVTLPVLLGSLWIPMFSGILQGRQDFFWLGWASIFNGVGRLIVASLIVLAFAGGATGMMIGVLVGVALSVVVAVWRTRDLWSLPAEPFDKKPLLRQVVPLLIGFGSCQFMFTSDTMFAKAYFTGDQMAAYVAAGTLSRALLWLVMPLASVMFPKIVHSSVKLEKTNLFKVVVLGTAVLTACGVLGLWLVGPFVVKLVFTPAYVAATTAILPWYALAMVPLALANVLVNDLLARSRFGVVPLMVLLALAYSVVLPLMLDHFPGRLQVPLQTLAVFNTLLFGICAWFTWGPGKKKTQTAA
jgi:O-antigen/teichoic acid export membrane protein